MEGADADFTKGLAYIRSAVACRRHAETEDRLTAERLKRFADWQSLQAQLVMFGTGRCSAPPDQNGLGAFSEPERRASGLQPG